MFSSAIPDRPLPTLTAIATSPVKPDGNKYMITIKPRGKTPPKSHQIRQKEMKTTNDVCDHLTTSLCLLRLVWLCAHERLMFASRSPTVQLFLPSSFDYPPTNHVTPSFHLPIGNSQSLLLGEGHFDDGNKPSGTATPTVDPVDPRGGKRKKVAGGKKAKTTKQRLAIADGEME